MSSPESVRVTCTECRASVRVETTDLGDWVTCPKCSGEFRAKDPSDAPKPKTRPTSRDDRDEDEEEERDRGRRRRKDDDDEEEDDRDRRRRKNRDDDRDRSRSRRRDRDDEDEDEDDYGDERNPKPKPGTCPECGCRRSRKVSYTWWGGFVGPAVFHIVRCTRCGQQYNSKTGTPIGAKQILIYSGVILGILAFIGVAALVCGGLAK